MNKKLKILFMGTPEIAVDTLAALVQNPLIEIVSVISMPDRPAGRGQKLNSPEVIEYARANSLPFFQTENINQEEKFLKELPKLDLIIVFAFAQFLGTKILKLPKIGCFNIHTSLLPLYRGAAPIQYALLNDDKETGITIQRMVKKMDAGDIAYQKVVKINPNEKAGELYLKLKALSAEAIGDFISMLMANKITFTVQNEELVSFAPTLTKDAGHLKFSEMKTKDIMARLRAFDPWPGIYCFLNNKRLKILNLETASEKLKPGEIDITRGKILIGTIDGSVRLKLVQLEGKKPSEDIDLLNGFREKLTIT